MIKNGLIKKIAVFFALASLAGCFFLKNTQEKTNSLKLTNQKLMAVVLLMLWSIMSLSEISEFLYFNFWEVSTP